MCSNFSPLYAFLGGAIVGAGAALLFAPKKGADLRDDIVQLLRQKGLLKDENKLDEMMDELKEIADNADKK